MFENIHISSIPGISQHTCVFFWCLRKIIKKQGQIVHKFTHTDIEIEEQTNKMTYRQSDKCNTNTFCNLWFSVSEHIFDVETNNITTNINEKTKSEAKTVKIKD